MKVAAINGSEYDASIEPANRLYAYLPRPDTMVITSPQIGTIKLPKDAAAVLLKPLDDEAANWLGVALDAPMVKDEYTGDALAAVEDELAQLERREQSALDAIASSPARGNTARQLVDNPPMGAIVVVATDNAEHAAYLGEILRELQAVGLINAHAYNVPSRREESTSKLVDISVDMLAARLKQALEKGNKQAVMNLAAMLYEELSTVLHFTPLRFDDEGYPNNGDVHISKQVALDAIEYANKLKAAIERADLEEVHTYSVFLYDVLKVAFNLADIKHPPHDEGARVAGGRYA